MTHLGNSPKIRLPSADFMCKPASCGPPGPVLPPPFLMKRLHKKRLQILNARGYTLIELLVTIAIISVLVAVGAGSYAKFIRIAERGVCIERMKNLHVVLSNYLGSNHEWPQMPEELETADEDQHWAWWQKTLKEYGANGQSDWLCPTDERARKKEGKERAEHESSYNLTDFDEGSDTPYRWKQPWVLERSDFHGQGQLCVMPDGSVVPLLGAGGN